MQSKAFHRAIKKRDKHFDGKFFFGVRTTGIYCRPICPARPKKENIEFFMTASEARASGYRPCLRCRPDAAPGSAAWRGKSALVARALKLIGQHRGNSGHLAEKLGVSSRHVRRLLRDEIGICQSQIKNNIRLEKARKLIIGTKFSITEIAFSSGFTSIRRFNDATRKRFNRSPREIRKEEVRNASS